MAYKLYDSCNGEKQLYIVHGADHTENYRKDPGGYEKIVTKFIEERLRQKKCQTVRPAKGVQSDRWKSCQISC